MGDWGEVHFQERDWGRRISRWWRRCRRQKAIVKVCISTVFGSITIESLCMMRELIDNNTWARGDMEFLFERSTWYLTSERSERVRYRIEHEKRNSISPSNHVLLCLLYKHKSPKYYWDNFYLKATAVSVKAEDKSNSSSTDSNKLFSNTFINTIENFSLSFYFHFIITTLYCFICPYSLVDNLKSPYLRAPD